MDEQFGKRLERAIAAKGLTNNFIGKHTNIHPTTIKNWITGSSKPDYLKLDTVILFLGVNKRWLLDGVGEMDESNTNPIKIQNPSNEDFLSHIKDPEHLINPTAKDALKKLNEIKKKRKGEGRLIDESELVPVEQYIIPIKGQAGLKKAFFYPDEYVENNFEKELAYVKPKDRAVYHKIEVDGGSMPNVLNPGEWARCVEIPKNLWLDKGTFKANKIYCLWHKDLGILFKRISKVRLDVITLSSDNPDKSEYPDQDFQLMEFSKILIVKMKEVIL